MIRELKDQVTFILATYPETRNSDFLLNVKRMEQFESVYFTRDQIHMLQKFNRQYDSTSRARRLVQAADESLCPTEPKVRVTRRKREVAMKKELGYPDQAFRIQEAVEKKELKIFDDRKFYEYN